MNVDGGVDVDSDVDADVDNDVDVYSKSRIFSSARKRFVKQRVRNNVWGKRIMKIRRTGKYENFRRRRDRRRKVLRRHAHEIFEQL